MSNVALPTIGRVVYLHSEGEEKPFVGFVADVAVGDNPLTINCGAMMNSGAMLIGGLQAIPHASQRPNNAPIWWDWMPFQKGQAAKTEELEKQLKSPRADGEMGKMQSGAPSPVDGKR